MMAGVPSSDLPVADTIRAALASADDEERWELVSHLHLHGGQEAFDAAAQLCTSTEPAHRALGADILGQVGVSPKRSAAESPFRNDAMRVLLDLVESEQDPAVLSAIAVAFGHLGDPRAVNPLVRLHTHTDPAVRESVAHGLLTRPERIALDALIDLSADTEASVRDWATFGLARQSDADFAELRDALASRTSDPDIDTRVEAIHGLATRGDKRAIEPLLDLLAAPQEVSDTALLEDALCALAVSTNDRRLCLEVMASRDRWLETWPGDDDLPDDLRAALDVCAVLEMQVE